MLELNWCWGLQYILGEFPLSTPTSDEILRAEQEAHDERMARELHDLLLQEQELQSLLNQKHELAQMMILQQLENQELLLQGLLNEQRALDLAEKTAAAALEAQARLKEAQAIPANSAPVAALASASGC